MTWQQKVIVRILLLVAVMLSDDESLKREIQQLSTHIRATAGE